MNRPINTRGLAAFGGSRLRKLLWVLTTFERPYIWSLPLATALLIYLAPADVLTRWSYIGALCQWLIAAVPRLRFEPSSSPFPQVVQLGACLAFLAFWAHLALAIIFNWVKPLSNAEHIRRMREAGKSVSKGLVGGVVLIALALVSIWSILTSGGDPDIYTRALLTGRLRLALFVGFGPFVLAIGIVTTVAISASLASQRFLR